MAPKRVNVRTNIGMRVVLAILFERRVGGGAAALQHGDRLCAVFRQSLTRPKSTSLISPLGASLILLGLMSRCSTGSLARACIRAHRTAGAPNPTPRLRSKSIAAAGFVHQFFKVLAGNIVHHQIIAAVFGEVVGDFGQIGMIEAGQHAGLLAELALQLVDDFGLERSGRFERLLPRICGLPGANPQPNTPSPCRHARSALRSDNVCAAHYPVAASVKFYRFTPPST